MTQMAPKHSTVFKNGQNFSIDSLKTLRIQFSTTLSVNIYPIFLLGDAEIVRTRHWLFFQKLKMFTKISANCSKMVAASSLRVLRSFSLCWEQLTLRTFPPQWPVRCRNSKMLLPVFPFPRPSKLMVGTKSEKLFQKWWEFFFSGFCVLLIFMGNN